MSPFFPKIALTFLATSVAFVSAQTPPTDTFTILSLYTGSGCPTSEDPISFTPTASRGNCTNVDSVRGVKFSQYGQGCDVKLFMKKDCPSGSFGQDAQLSVCTGFNGGLIESISITGCDYPLPASGSATNTQSTSTTTVRSSSGSSSTTSSGRDTSTATTTQASPTSTATNTDEKFSPSRPMILGLGLGVSLGGFVLTLIGLGVTIWATRDSRRRARENAMAQLEEAKFKRKLFKVLDRLDPSVRSSTYSSNKDIELRSSSS